MPLENDYAYHPIVIGAETSDLQAGTLTRIGQAVTQGAPAAAISGVLSVVNTARDFVGAEQLDTEQVIRKYDEQMGDYYADHKKEVDIVGFVGTALVPGTLGIKAARAVSGGNALGPISRAMALPASRKAHYLDEALKEVAQGGGVVKNILSANRRKQLGWEVVDQMMLGAAAEAAVALTMNDSPVFDNDTFKDFAWNFGLGTLLSGGIGGPLAALGARGILKAAQTEVQATMRGVDTVFNPGNLGLTKGTELLLFAENIAKLPDNFADIPFRYTFDGAKREMMLPLSETLQSTKDRATKMATDKLAIEFTNLAEGNAVVGQEFFKFIGNAQAAVKATGASADEVIDAISGQLANLKRVGHIDLDEAAMDARKFYVNLHPDAKGAGSRAAFDNLISTKRGKGFAQQPYRLADDVTGADLQIEQFDYVAGKNLYQTFKDNKAIDAVQLSDGSIRINPYSSRILKVPEDPNRVKMFIDLETGSHLPEAVATFGDVLTKAGVKAGDDFISAGNRRTTFQMPAQKATDFTVSPLEASARFAWASDKGVNEVIRLTGGRVDLDDLPVLQRLVELEPQVAADTLERIKFMDRGQELSYSEIPSLRDLAEVRRLEILETQMARFADGKLGSVPDIRAVAAHLNVSRDWVEEAIDRGYRLPTAQDRVAGQVLPTGDALRPKIIQAEWDFTPTSGKLLPEDAYNMNMGPSHLATKELTRQYQLEVRQMVNNNAAAAVLGADDALIHDLNQLGRNTSIEGAGATTFGASNASYGERAKLYVQDTGKNVALITQRKRDEVVETLAPFINSLRESPKAAAELGVVTNALRSNPNKFIIDPTDPLRLISLDVADLAKQGKTIDEAMAIVKAQGGKHPHVYEISEASVADFLRTSSDINYTRQGRFTTLYNAAGLTRQLHSTPIIYAPPINTVKYPYHAFVRTKEQVGVASDISMITAKSEEQLRELVGKVDSNKFDVLFKADTDAYHKAKGDYDYGLGINESRINSELSRTGALHDFFPETRLENIATDWLEWHAKQEEKLVRTAVEVKNRQFFSEVRHLSDMYRAEAESVARGIGSKFKSKVADPFGDYIKTALNISKQQEVPILDSLNDFVDKVGVKAGDAMERAFREAKSGMVSWEDANKVAERYGMGMPYKDVDTYFAANERYPRNLIREAFQKANMFLATATLRLDFANSLLNIISTPIMLGTEMQSIKGMIKNDAAAAGALRELTTVGVPGQTVRAPSTVKLTASAISNFFGQDKDALIKRYKDIGAVKEVSQLYHEVLDDLSFRPAIAGKDWTDKVSAAVEKGAKITGNTFAEDFTRFVSADVMRQMTEPLVTAGKLSVKEQNAYISTFVNRVQGNYVTSQRPIVFQGTTGAAVSLFQTYAFNVLQQLHRHMQAGDKKTLAVFAGLQSTVFGFNGLPFFDAVNTHLIGSLISNNPEHRDAYNVLPGFNKELGDWMMYGTASAMPLFSGSSPALYTRGDINPRHVTVLPTNPLDVPAVQASLRLVDTIVGFGKNIGQGVDVSDALLHGLQHQGLNRPLAGFAQLMAGRTTTSKGTLISAANELQTTSWLGGLAERTVSVEGVSRLMGARPMDEAVALNNMYRNKTYQVLDKARIERLGTAVKTKLYGGEAPTEEEMEDFMLRYTRSGGRIETFNQFMMRATRDANVSIINQTMAKTNTSYGRHLKTIMGGEQIEDYASAPPSQESEE